MDLVRSAVLTGLIALTPCVSQAEPWDDAIAEASSRFGLPAVWVREVIRAESGGDVRALSPKGAVGLMQLMPETWQRLRVELGLGSDPFQPRDNVLAGVAYLRSLYDRYGAPAFLAAYNAGPARLDAYLLKSRPLPAETLRYVARLAPAINAAPITPPTVFAVRHDVPMTDHAIAHGAADSLFVLHAIANPQASDTP